MHARELDETNRGVVALYAELDENTKALKRLSDLKSRFLSEMSHEFRSPLNSIRSLSGFLLDRSDGDLTAEQEKQVRFIRKAAEDLIGLVDDLLDLARVEAGKAVVRPTRFEVQACSRASRARPGRSSTGRRSRSVFEDPSAIPPLFTDEGKLTQILRNFLSNAVKFTERGEIRVAASLEARTTGHLLGGGHRHRDRPRGSAADLRGVRPDREPTPEADQGDRTGVAPGAEAGRSAGRRRGRPEPARRRFDVLGDDPADLSAAGRGRARVAVGPRIGDGSSGDRSAGPVRVLIVDDHDEARYALKGTLARAGSFLVIEAARGEEALDRARAEHPDVIFLDLGLPDMTGFQVLDRLKADETCRDIPVIIHTSRTLDDEEPGRSTGRVASILEKSFRSRGRRGGSPAGLAGETRSRATEECPERSLEMSDRPKAAILLVDDDETKRYAIARTLRRAEYTVEEAATGAEALRLAAARPDLIILDVKLPDIDGFEVCRRIKSDPATGDPGAARLHHVRRHRGQGPRPGERGRRLSDQRRRAAGAAGHRAGPLAGPTAEDAAQLSTRQWQTTFDAISDGVMLLDAEGKVVQVNRTLERILGRPWTELVGKDIPATAGRRRSAGADALRADARVRRAARPGKWRWATSGCASASIRSAMRITSSRGPSAWSPTSRARSGWRCSSSARPGACGRPTAARTSSWRCSPTSCATRWPRSRNAVAAHRLAGGRRADMAQDAREIDRAAGAAHGPPGRRPARRLADHPRQDRAAQSQAVDLGAIVAHAVETTRPLIEAARPRARRRAARTEPLLVEGDPTRLEQVVANLLNNAAKYTDRGGHIALAVGRGRRAWRDPRRATTASASRPRCCRASSTCSSRPTGRSTASQGGLGIGLTLVRSLVEMHGGTVEASSDGPGKGSEFVVRLPRRGRRPGAPRRRMPRPGRRRVGGREPPRPRGRRQPRRRADARRAAHCSCGARRPHASDGPDGPSRSPATFQPDVVLLDIGLPGHGRLRGRPAASRAHGARGRPS